MKNIETIPVIGPPLSRVDGHLKVTGAATYPSDVALTDMVHAVLVQSTVACGRIRTLTTSAAERASGVLAIITHANAPKLARGPVTSIGPAPMPPLQDDRILYYGQHVAVVVAGTFEQAGAAARLIEIDYESFPPILSFDDPRATLVSHPWTPDEARGNVDDALASSSARIDATYTTATNTQNPIGLFATVAAWEDDSLVVHDTTQWPHGVRESLAAVLGIPGDRVRVLTPFVGGAFGAGLRVLPHVVLTALAAREVKRPVKLVLTRAQMFTLGNRPNTVQRISIGATKSGELVAIDHEATSSLNVEDELFNPLTIGTPESYKCPNVSVRARQARLNIAPPGWMRAPGHSEGNFALESALDELSYALGLDPLELRMRNHAEVHPDSGLPWSSNALAECYKQGADRFGWSGRISTPRSMRNGHLLVGYGMARASLSFYQPPCKARASIHSDGTAFVRSAATDIGTATYTVMTVLAAEILGLPIERVRFGLGDTQMPNSPQEGGSGLAGALGNAVYSACTNLIQKFADLGKDASCTYTDILTRHHMDELTADGGSPEVRTDKTKAPAGSFAAQFVEVNVDPDLGTVRVVRVVSAVDGGRILNQKTARSQIIGGIAGGIGMALLEETVVDPSGRLVNASLGDYLVAVNADVPDIDVIFVGEPDTMSPIGTKGIGELSLVGMGAAVANAIYHATGNRIRSLPITLDKVYKPIEPTPLTADDLRPTRNRHQKNK